MSKYIDFQAPFQQDLPKPLLGPLYEGSKSAIRKASRVLTLEVRPDQILGPIPMPQQVEASALSMALGLGNLLSSSYSTARATFGTDRARDWLTTALMWFSKLQEQQDINLNVRIMERE